MKQTFILSTLLVLFAACSAPTTPYKKDKDLRTSNPDSIEGKHTYVNQGDNKTYSSNKPWEVVEPEGGVKWDPGNVQMEKVIMLTQIGLVPGRIDIDTIGDYINGTKWIVERNLAKEKGVGQVLVQYTVHATKPVGISVSYNGKISEKALLVVQDSIKAVSRYIRTKKDSVVVQVLYGVNRPHPEA